MEDIKVNVIRDEPVVIKNTVVPTEPVEVSELREIYRNIAENYANKLKRSVCKRYETPPSFEGYQSEIDLQEKLWCQILYMQNCRSAIELAADGKKGVVAGEHTTTTFTRQSDGKILVEKIEY